MNLSNGTHLSSTSSKNTFQGIDQTKYNYTVSSSDFLFRSSPKNGSFMVNSSAFVIGEVKSFLYRRNASEGYYRLLIQNMIKSSRIHKITRGAYTFHDEVQRPVDEPILKSIVYMGLAPTFDRMVDEIRRNIA